MKTSRYLSLLLLIVLAVSLVTACTRPDASVTADPQPRPQSQTSAVEAARQAAAQPHAATEQKPRDRPSGKSQAGPPLSGWETAKVYLDVVYSEAGELKLHMDVAVPPGKGPFPAIAMFPGGMPVQDPRQDLHSTMQFFLRHGYVVSAVEYRGPAAGRFPAPVDDAKNAIRFLRKDAGAYRIDPRHIGIWGMSMGGGVALMLAVTDDDFGGSRTAPTVVSPAASRPSSIVTVRLT